jgi:hypothetical protein
MRLRRGAELAVIVEVTAVPCPQSHRKTDVDAGHDGRAHPGDAAIGLTAVANKIALRAGRG